MANLLKPKRRTFLSTNDVIEVEESKPAEITEEERKDEPKAKPKPRKRPAKKPESK